ncbi:annexin A13-like [Vitis riparia]|uniref:annexin A13-like n=1 Tax=Vitis riparia TaxID=96939 RepID=UPI00155A3D30|nr:annexin A13-like [Vitis riparia]
MESRSTQASKKYQLDCQYLNSCFSGNDPNNIITKQKLVELLTTRSQQELKLIRQTYITLYNKDLLHVLSGIRKNDAFANLVHLRLSEPQDRDADIVRDALFGGRVNLNAVIEVVCTRSSSELHSVKQAYRFRYNSDVEQDITLKAEGGFKEILLAVLKSSRKYGSKVDRSMAMCDAKTLYEAMESGIFVDWKAVISLMSERNTGQLKAILISYKELYGQEFSKFLKCNKCGKFGKELRVVVRGMQYPERFLAKQLNRARQNSNAREVVARIIISRLEVDIKNISNVFAAKTRWSLGNLVRREFNTSGSGNSHASKANALLAEFLLGLLKRC